MRKIYKNEKSTEMRERGFAGNALYHASCSITVSAIFMFSWAIVPSLEEGNNITTISRTNGT